jgi:hypothetical protein
MSFMTVKGGLRAMNTTPFLRALATAGLLASSGSIQGCSKSSLGATTPQTTCRVDGARLRCQAPGTAAFTLPAPPVVFSAGQRAGYYILHSGYEQSEETYGAVVAFEGEPVLDVRGELFRAWLGRGTIEDALAGRAPASNWGEPISNAFCSGNPCSVLKQSFTHGEASLPLGGGVIWTGVEPGLIAPINVGRIARGYVQPPIPFDRRTLTGPRSGDYITLVWRNQATVPNVTTTLHRSVTPQNGTPGPWTLIHTFPPPTPAAGSFAEFTDSAAVNNARNCYFLTVSNGSANARSAAACAYTLDGTTVDGVDRSVPRPVRRAQIRIQVPASPGDSGSTKLVAARLESFAGGKDYNFTRLDSTVLDFGLGSDRTYDLDTTSIEDVSDIVGVTVSAYRDNMRVSAVELIINNQPAYSRTFEPPVLVDNSDFPGGRSLVVGFDELRSNPLWQNLYIDSQNRFFGFDRDAFKAKLDSVTGDAVLDSEGAAYYGSRLLDGSTTSVTKPAGYRSDRVRVTQRIRASAIDGVNCTIAYDLRLVARSIYGNDVSPFWNGPFVQGSGPGSIYTTEVLLENSAVSCSAGAWKNFIDTLLKVGPNESPLSTVEGKVRKTLEAGGPTSLSAPPPHRHFCFPGAGEGEAGAAFRNGGLTLCADQSLGAYPVNP